MTTNSSAIHFSSNCSTLVIGKAVLISRPSTILYYYYRKKNEWKVNIKRKRKEYQEWNEIDNQN